jgi:CelD/BcsL family acetyltransferase involved in cellulose biosynthesis
LLHALLAEGGSWTIAILENWVAGSPSHKATVAAAERLGMKVVAEPARNSPYVDLTSGWESYFAGLGEKMRSNIRRRQRRLEESGEVNVELVSEAGGFTAALDICFEISKRSWKAPLNKDLGGRPERERFYREYLELAAQRGWASIALLKLDSKYLAFEVLLRRGSNVLGLAVDYDQEFKRVGPSMLLRSYLLEQLASKGISKYDFGGADYDHKLQWTSEALQHVRLWLFKRSFSSRCLYWVKRRLAAGSETTAIGE